MRTNIYQEQIVRALENTHVLSLAELQEQIPEADFSTVYRNVQQLVTEGVLRPVVIDRKRTVYELGNHSHDHFICTDCQTVEAVTLPKQALGSKVVSDVVVRGQCEGCQS